MKSKTIILILLAATLSLGAMAQQPIPQTIPALREWKSSKGTLTMPSQGRIVVNVADSLKLHETASILKNDLKELLGWNYKVAFGKAGHNDIFLCISITDKDLGDEGYTLSVKNKVSIEAPTTKGVLWGTRSLLQMLHKQQGQLLKGTARDWPEFPNRGYMLDVGRKFFTMDYLEQQVKTLSFYKMNEFQIHLNDNGFPQFFNNDWNQTYAAFRLESERFPGLTAKDGSYTKEEFKELQKMAAKYGVTIIPEIDIPAHSLAFTHYKPEIGTQEYGMDHLDLYKEETYEFVDALLDEYIGGDDPVFIGNDFHIGTDEYNKKETEKYRYFTDRYLKFVTNYGKSPRMWGGLKWLDGETEVLAEGVTVNAWSYDWVDPVASLEAGYKLINSCDTYLYIVPAAGYYREFLDHRWIYETWTPWIMNSRQTLEVGTPGVLGGMFAVWNDKCGNGISEQDVTYRAFPAIQVLAEKMWKNGNAAVTYEEFDALCKEMPEAPGVNLLGKTGDVTLLGADEELILNGRESKSTEVEEVGYPYSVTFSIRPEKNSSISAVLFKGPHSTVYTNWENKGQIGFTRDGYAYSFTSYTLPEEEWTEITISGDWKGTSLYVNGQLQERLEGRAKRVYNPRWDRLEDMAIQETLIFPLHQIGDTLNGFKGAIKNLRIEQH